jgi:glycine C-acetyltransferase
MLRRATIRFDRNALRSVAAQQLKEIEAAGTLKRERVITSPQRSSISVTGRQSTVLNFCANNYLGFSDNERVVTAAKAALDTHGFGMSSVRFICGTQDIHKQLEKDLSAWLGTEDTILYPSAFDANAGVFEALLTEQDAVISDALNHASIIDGIRLCKAERHRYKHLDMAELEEVLRKTQDKRIKLIVTDGAFSMDGDVAPLDKIVALAEKYGANIFVDDAHGTGVYGKGGQGTPTLFGVADKIDILNSTLGKALGGASGGFSSGCKEMVMLQRQRGRPYLFSNAMAPCVTAGCAEALRVIKDSPDTLTQLRSNLQLFRTEMKKAGFNIVGHQDSPIVPVMLGDAKLAANFAERMLERDIYVIGFSYPVVPKDQARIRVQLSAAHSTDDVKKCIAAFIETKKELKL